MNCEHVSRKLIPYVDGRADTAERRAVEEHLAACSACRARVEEFRRTWLVLDEVPLVEPSLGFDARLRRRIAAEPQSHFWNWLPELPRPAFTVALLIALSLWISFRPVPTQPGAVAGQSEQDFKMIKDLRVLEDYDVLRNFDALSELPPVAAQTPSHPQPNQQQDGGQM